MDANADDAAVRRGLDGLVRREAETRRARTRWLRQSAADEATFAGVLRSMLEQRAVVVVTTRVGSSHQGVITAIGRDCAVVSTASPDAAQTCVVRMDAVTSVRSRQGPARAVMGDRTQVRDVLFSEVLAGLAAERADVVVRAYGEQRGLIGQLLVAGHDVVTLRLSATDVVYVHLPLTACAAVSHTAW